MHALLYLYELAFIPSGVSVHTLSADDTLGRSIFSGPQFHDNQDLFHLLIKCPQMAQAEPKLLYESPGGNLVGGLPPAAHMVATRRGTPAQVARDRRPKNNYV